jgi:hypothetical protein
MIRRGGREKNGKQLHIAVKAKYIYSALERYSLRLQLQESQNDKDSHPPSPNFYSQTRLQNKLDDLN